MAAIAPDGWRPGAPAAVTLKRRTDKSSLQLERFPVSILATTPPDRLKEILEEGDDGLAARFLYAWPGPRPHCPLANGRIAADDDALKMLRRIGRLARTPEDPLVLVLRPARRGSLRRLPGRPARRPARDRRAGGGLAGQGTIDRGAAGRRAGVARLVGQRCAGPARPYRPRAGRGRRGAVDGLFPAACARRARPRGADRLPSDRVQRVARWLKEGRVKVVVARGHQARCAGAGPSMPSAPTRCSIGCTALGIVRPDRATTQDGPWPSSPALACQSGLGGRVKGLAGIPEIPDNSSAGPNSE